LDSLVFLGALRLCVRFFIESGVAAFHATARRLHCGLDLKLEIGNWKLGKRNGATFCGSLLIFVILRRNKREIQSHLPRFRLPDALSPNKRTFSPVVFLCVFATLREIHSRERRLAA
jgi:hypothetical protein